MPLTYDKGDVLRITGTYTNAVGAAIDPSVPMFSVRAPSGATTTYTYPTDVSLVRLSQGIYYSDVRFTTAGKWSVRMHSTGTGEASAEQEYVVKQSAFP